jgi:hypothetical protein
MAAANESTGVGKWVLGWGPTGTHGHVEIALCQTDQPDAVNVLWSTSVDVETEELISRYVRDCLTAYTHGSGFGLRAEILHVGVDPVRQNDYKRAANLAIRDALEGLGLQPPEVFSALELSEETP